MTTIQVFKRRSESRSMSLFVMTFRVRTPFQKWFSRTFPIFTLIFQDTTISYFLCLVAFAGLHGHGSESIRADKWKQIPSDQNRAPLYSKGPKQHAKLVKQSLYYSSSQFSSVFFKIWKRNPSFSRTFRYWKKADQNSRTLQDPYKPWTFYRDRVYTLSHAQNITGMPLATRVRFVSSKHVIFFIEN